MWARSYTARALFAVGFLLLFYTVTLGLALGLLAVPYLLYTTHRIPSLLAVECVVGVGSLMGACALLWSLLPRSERFVPPGPWLTEAEHPRLFEALRDVARRMDARRPSEVYLVPGVNAFVSQEGGVLGFGGRRILVLGLGLLAVDNLSQFRAAVAHELGHFQSGETKLVGLIQSTRSAMIRALGLLGRDGQRVLRPFAWMPEVFLRMTQAISRQQELVADEWSMRIAGKRAHISGLRCEQLHEEGFRRFLEEEVYPLADRGVVPDNLFEGYRRYLASPAWTGAVRELAGALPEPEPDPYDSHPGLEERIAFAGRVDVPEQPWDETPAYTLLTDAEALERRFTAELWPEAVELIPWSEVGARWGVLWNETASRVQARVPDFSLARVPRLLRDPAARETFAEAIHPRLVGDRAPDRAERVREVVCNAVSAYLASILGRHGLEWKASPGEPLKLERDGLQVEPLAVVERLLEGRLGPEEWEHLLERHGVAADETWSVKEKDREVALAPRAPVTVRESRGAVTVRGPFSRLGLPQCCALCGGTVARYVEERFPVGGMLSDRGGITIQVPTCEAHAPQAHRAFKVRRYEEESDLITLEVPNSEYAHLIQRSNA